MKLPDRPLRIAFFGTPEIAQTVLAGLLDAKKDEVVLVVCQPDRPKGRGRSVESPPTKQLAEARGVPVLQPTKMRDGAVAKVLEEREIDLAVVTAFGRILPKDLLEAPRFGAWNVHASLLPRHRGASPINFAILEGDPETGITLMQMTEGLDEGPMLAKAAIPIREDDTTHSLTQKLAELGRRLLLEGIEKAKKTGLEAEVQDEALATFAPLIKKEDGPSPTAAVKKSALTICPPVKPPMLVSSWSLAKATRLPVKVTVPMMPVAMVATRNSSEAFSGPMFFSS